MTAKAPGKWLITLSVMLPTMIEVLDTSVANVALEHIQGSLSAGQDEVTWVLTSYLVANAVVIPMSGWLSRMMGRKRYLVASVALFTLSSLLCGAATNLVQIILFRVMQGIGGGGLQPVSQAILLETFPAKQRGMAMAIFGLGVVMGPIFGPLVGGWITDTWSWRWIFYINLPFGVLAFYMCSAFVQDPPYLKRAKKGEEVDVLGLALLSVGIGCLQIVLDRGQQDDWFASTNITVMSIIAVFALSFLVWWELRHKNPVLDLRIFKRGSFSIGCVVMFLGFFAFFGSIVLLPMFLQGLMGYTALLAGLVLGPSGAVVFIFMPIAGKLTERIDARWILSFGLLLCSYSLYLMAGFNLNIDFFSAALPRAIQGAAMPFFFVALSYLTFAYVKNNQMNNASALYNLLRNLGGSFGTAFVTTLLARRAQYHQNILTEHMTPLNPIYQLRLSEIQQALTAKLGPLSDHLEEARAFLYQELMKEANALAFNDAFYIQCLIFLCLVGGVWFMKKPPIKVDEE